MLRSTFRKSALVISLFVYSLASIAQNQALDLSGTGNEVNVLSYQLTTGPGFTVEQWINIPVLTQSTILVNQSSSNFPAPMDAYVNTDGSVTFLLGNGTATFTSATTATGLITAGTWHHVAIVYDPASVGTEGQIFIDGNMTPAATATNPAAIGNLGPIRIGRRADLAEGDDIYVDEVRIWSIARDGAAINGDYDQELLGNEAGLDIYLRFEGNLADDAFLNGLQNGGMVAGSDTYIAGAPIIENNYALNFDGIDEYVNLGTDIRDQLTGLSSVTVEGWVYRTADKSFHTIFGNYGSDLQTLLRIDGTPAANIAFWVNNGSGFISATGSTTIPINTWTHVAGTWDGTTIRVYVNGVEDGSAPHSGTLGSNGNNYHIGGDPTAPGGEFMQGQIDEVRVWSTTRAASQLLAFKDVELNGPEPNLVAYYDFEDGPASTLLLDRENDVPIINGSLTNMEVNDDWVVSTHGVAAAGPLDTTNPDVTISSTELDPTAANPIPITITFTEEVVGFELSDIFVTNGSAGNLNTADNTIFTADITPSSAGLVTVDVFGGSATDLTGNGNNAATSFSITSDAEPPVIIATSLSADRTTVIVEFNEDIFGAADGSTAVDAADFTINTVTAGTASLTYDNAMTPISASEVTLDVTISGAPDGTELFEVVPTNATAIYDLLGTPATVSQSANQVRLGDNGVLSLDGVDDFVRVSADAAFDVQQYTLEAWVNFQDPSPSGLYTIISKGVFTGVSDLNGYSLLYGDNGGVGITLAHKSSSGVEFFVHPIVLNADTWYHIAGTFDGSEMKIFVDGVEVAQNSSLVAFDIDHVGDYQDLKIGVFEGDANANFLQGKVDEVRVWNYARDAAQISTLMDEEISGNQTGLLAYYDFNSTSGTIVTDGSPAVRNGTFDPAMDQTGATGNWASGGTILAAADITAPSITFAQNLLTIGSTIIGGTHDDNLAAIEVSLDGGSTRSPAINNGDGTWNYDLSTDPLYGGSSPYTLDIYITDEAENEFNIVGNVTVDIQNALDFDGVDDVVNVGNTIQGLAALTFEAWVYYTEDGAVYNEIFTKEFVNSWGIDPADKIWFHVGNGSTWLGSGVASTSSVPKNVWTHLAVTWDGSTVEMYINGKLDHVEAHAGPMGSNAVDRGIGNYGNINANPFQGSIDELRAWSVVRTQEQIIADAYTTLTSGTGLLASYDFNQGNGGVDNAGVTSLPDISGNGINGTLSAPPFTLNGGSSNWVVSTAFDNDVFAPIFVGGTPVTSNFGANNFDLTVQLNEVGLVSYVVLTNGAAAPTTDEIRAGTGFLGAPAVTNGTINVTIPSTNFVGNIIGLASSTDYDLYIVAEDNESTPNVSNDIFIDVLTLAGPAPGGVNTNLSLWLKADQGVTGTTQVSQWDDHAGGLRHATQPTATNQPALTDVAINYNPAISFDGTDDFFTSPLDITPATTPDLTAIIVFNSNTASAALLRKLFGHDAGSFQRSVGIDNRSGTNVGYFTGSGVADYFNLVASQNYLSTTEYTSSTFSGYIDGFQLVNGAAVTNTGGNATLSIGAINLAGSERWDGQIAEMIMYSSTLTGPERQRIETYLAIKYGISIDQTAATNYFASDGNPVWDGTANATYNQSIAGIGRDDQSALNQKQSMSADGRLSIGLGGIAASNQANANTFTNDLAYLVWGDNGLDLAFGARDIVNVPSGIDSRPQRIWRASEANSDVGNVMLRFDLNGEGYPASYNPGNFKLLLDTDADFSTGAIEITADSYAGGIVEFNSVNITNGQFFTLGVNEPPLPPTNLIVYNSSPTEITFEWTDNAINETGYQIIEADNYGISSGIAIVDNIAANSTSYTHTPSAPKYYLVVPTNGFEDPTSQSPVEFATNEAFPGQTLDFDGTGSQYISIPDNDAFSFGNGTTDSPMSVEAWIYLDQITSRSIISKRSGENEWHLVISSDGRVSVTLADQSASGFLFGESPVIGFNLGEWYHVAFTYDGSSTAAGINTYVNGVLQAQTPGSSGSYTAMENTNSPVEIGTLNSGASFNFDGRIDEVKVWDFVKTDFSDRLTPIDFSVPANYAGLVAYYPLDEGISQPKRVDRSPNVLDGDAVGIPASLASTILVPPAPVVANAVNVTNTSFIATWEAVPSATSAFIDVDDNADFSSPLVTDHNVGDPTGTFDIVPASLLTGTVYYYRVSYDEGSGVSEESAPAAFMVAPGQMLTFDGVDLAANGDHVTVGNIHDFSTGDFTIEAWIRRSGSGTTDWIVSNGLIPTTNGQHLHFGFTNSNVLSLDMLADGTAANPVTAITDNNWHHVAVTFTDASNAVDFYIDGILLPDDGAVIANFTGTNDFRIGGAFGSEFFAGDIDEVRVWNTARAASEIQNDLYKRLTGRETGLVAYYRFDQLAGTTLPDLTINVNDGTLVNGDNSVPADGTTNGPVWGASGSQAPLPYVVTNINDSGPGSLRQAILDANASASKETITFNIPDAGPWIISPLSALPTIDNPGDVGVIIDGTTQPGWDINTAQMVVIDPSNAGLFDGLTIDEPATEIYGLAIQDFSDGIQVNNNAAGVIIGAPGKGNLIFANSLAGINLGGVNGATIQGNRIGTLFDGLSTDGNGRQGILMSGSQNVTIGGDSGTGEGNLISGNGGSTYAGIQMNATTTLVNIYGNLIGTDINGDNDLGNAYSIAVTSASDINIGSLTAGHQNVIAGSAYNHEIDIDGSSSNVTVQNNIIGLNSAGNTRIESIASGVNGVSVVSSATGVEILNNTISGMSGSGVNINGGGIVVDTKVRDNFIGTNSSGTAAGTNLANLSTAIYVNANGVDNTTGRIEITGNVVSGNGDSGSADRAIALQSSTNILVQNNNIGVETDGLTAYGNIGYGIYMLNASNLEIDGNVIAHNGREGIFFDNRAGLNTGVIISNTNTYFCNTNQAINFETDPATVDAPVITNVSSADISGTSTAADATNIDIYQVDVSCADDQGAVYVGSASVTSNAWSFSSPIDVSQSYVAIVNDPTTGMSEFSVSATAPPSIVLNTNDAGIGSLRDAIIYANANPGTTITFGLSGGGPYQITLATALPDITAAGTIIDGTSLAGWAFGDINNMVELDGSGLASNVSGLVINDVPNCSIYGLVVTGFTSISESVASIEINGDNADNAIIGAANMGNILHGMVSAGISFLDADFLTIQGNRFGTFDGTTRSEINKHVIYAAGTTDNVIIGGDSGAGEGNLISGAGNGRFGLRLNVQGSVFIRGNYIGTNSNGDASIFNEGGGMYLSGAHSGEIGGTAVGHGNVISGNTTGYGIRLGGSVAVINNIIGLDRTGTNPVSNGGDGIIIGGTGGVVVDGNIISSNAGDAITSTTGFGNADIINNIIGFDQSLTIARPNAGGIIIDNGPGTDNRYGYKDNPNIIANNTGAAIFLTNTSTGNTFATNQIYNNGSGIDFEAGANGSIAPPTIDNVTASDASGTGVNGTTIHLYLGDGSGQGQTFLDSTTVSGGIWSIPGLSLLTSDQVVATATDYGVGIGTSEFSAAASIPVQNALAFDGTDDHVPIGSNVFGGPYTGPFTVEAWVNSSLSGNNGTGVGSYGSGIFKNMENGSGAIGDLALTINNVGQIGLLNWREAAVDADGHTLSDASIPADTWTHVAASWDGSVNRIFINGVEQSFTQNGTSTSWATGFEIGRVHTAAQWHYDGTMDELRVWNVARSAVDITNNLYNELDPGTEVNLVAYYQFNQASGTNVPDAKGSFDATWEGSGGGTNTSPAWGASTALNDPASIVSNTNDTGAGSLRDAITFANANPGTTITFNIAEIAPWVINLGSALPQITAANTTIDGTTQPGWTFGDPTGMVQINGSGIGGSANGINIDAADVEVNGLILTGFAGTISNGAIYLASDAADNAIIGGANKGNIIHGTTGGNAIYIVNADNATIQGNRIGTLDGITLSAIGDHGIATTNEVTTLTIGGDFFTGEGNLISGAPTNRYGMNLFGSGGTGLSNVTIRGNKIGTNEAADGAIPNTLGGINILGTNSAITIGGPSPSDLNIISGNGDHGIIIQVGNGFDIDGNYIGLQSDGSSALGNGGSGIRINGTATNVNIGTNLQNFIAENVEYGIVYDGNSSSNTALGTNFFSCNQLGGIGYGSGPLTPGATIDNIGLTTANVTTAATDGSTVFVYFADDGCSNNQGLSLAGTGTVTGGQAEVSGGFAPSSHYVALVEDVNGYSQFSSPFFTNFVTVTNTNDSGTGSFRAAIDSANTYPGATIYFNIPGTGPWEITLASALPSITGTGTIIDATTQPFWDLSTANVPNIIGNAGINIGLNFTSVNNVEVYGIRLSEFNIDGIRYNVVGSAANGYTFGAAGKGNIFAGNGNGIQVLTYTGGGTIQGNYFGILPDGNTAGVSNGTGILLGTNANNVQIGGLGAGEGNVISNNTNDGIRLSAASFATIQGNNIGLNPLEATAFGGTNGIDLTSTSGTTVEQNVISGHGTGIRVNNSSGNTIIRNYIGVASDGTTEFGNVDGISIIDNLDSDNNIIGSPSTTSDGNIIAHNTNVGILINGAGNNGNQIQRNSMFGNLAGGISLIGGAHNGISAPAIDPIASANTVTGTGTNGVVIDLYLTDGTVQGANYLGSATVSSGVWTIGSLSLLPGDDVVVTATNVTDGTSGFSAATNFPGIPYPEEEGSGLALTFDGNNDFVDLGVKIAEGRSAITMEAWINPASLTPGGVADTDIRSILSEGSIEVGNTAVYLGFAGDNSETQLYAVLDAGGGLQLATYPASNIPLNEWSHVAMTWNSGEAIKLYVNGVEVAQSPTFSGSIISVTNDFAIGRSYNTGEDYFDGQIDEVRIWDFAMPESSLREYLARKVTNAHPSYANLLAYYRMDDSGDALTLRDFTPNVLDGTINGSNYAQSGAHIGDLSIYEYVYTAGSGRNLGDFSTQNLGTANLPLHIYQVNQTPTNNAASGFNVIDDTEYFGVFSPGQTYQARYANAAGVSQDQRILSRADLTDPAWVAASGFLGTEVQDDQIISPVLSGSAQFVTATQFMPYPAEIDGGSALSFDGVNDFVDLGGSPALSGHQNLTLEAWINPDYSNVSDHSAILSNLAPSVGGGGYQLSISNSNVRILYRDNTFTDRELIAGPLPEGEWSHLVGVIENAGANSNLYLYVNGIQVASSLANTGVPDYTSITNMFIGSNSDGVAGSMPLDREFGGQLDEVRIWNTVLTETEIRDHMIGRIDPDVVAFANLMAAYKFDDTDPNTAYDVAGSSDGAITEAVKVISGAPQGQGSIYSYNAGPAKLSTASFNEDIILNIDNATNGVHGYLIAGPPDQTSADGFNALDQTRYYGVFAPGNPKVDVRMDYNNGGSPDVQRRIVYRTDATDNAASGGWERVSGLINSDPTIDSVFAYNVAPGEFTTAVLNPPSTYPVLGDIDPGSALAFDGAGAYVDVPDADNLKIANAITIEAWARRTRLDAADVILEKGGDWTNGQQNYAVGLNDNASNNMFFFTWNGGGRGTDGVTDFDWHHYAVVAIEGNTDPLLYIDGVLQTIDNTFGNATIDLNEATTRNLHIGSQIDGGLTYHGANEIDEIRIWDAALSETDIQNFANTTDISSHPNYSDMVAYYKFDEGSGSSTLEDVFSNNDGTLTNMNPLSDWVASGALANAIPNNALDFDGSTDYVNMPASIALKDHVASTVEAWIRLDDLTGEKIIYSEERSVGTMYVLKVNAGFLQMGVDDGSVWSFATSSFPLNVGDWYHVAGTYADGVGTKVYINGVQVGSDVEEGRRGDGVNAAYIGLQTPGPLHFHGAIDEVRLWTTERDQNQIQSNMLNELTGSEPGLRAYYTFNQGVADGPNAGETTLLDQTTNVFHGTLLGTFDLTGTNSNWTASGSFNETLLPPANLITSEVSDSEISMTWEDRSASETDFAIFRSDGNNGSFSEIGTVESDVTFFTDNSVTADNNYFYYVVARNGGGDSSPSNEKAAATLAYPGNALTFDGTATNINLGNDASIDFDTGDFSISFWYKRDNSGAANDRLIYKGATTSDTQTGYTVFGSTSTLTFMIGDGATRTGVTASGLNTDTWYFVVATRTGSTMELYIDGTLSDSRSDAVAGSISNAGLSMTLGALGSSNNFFPGEMDEVAIWSKVLSGPEISSIMGASLIGSEGNLEAYYKFDQTDPGITVLPDRSTNQNDGILNGFGGAAIWSPSGANSSTPAPQNALNFGGNDYVDFTRQAFPTGLTYEAWIRTTSPANTTAYDGNPALAVIGDNDNSIEGAFGIHDGRVRYTHWTGLSTIFDQIDGTALVNDGQWHHIAVTHATSGDVSLYVDGVLDEVSATVTYHTTVAANRVGASYLDGTGNDNFFTGDIDEVRIWNGVVTSGDIRGYIFSTDLTGHPKEADLVLHYTMDQGDAGNDNSGETAVTDQSTSTLDGGLNGFALTGPTSNFVTSAAFDHSGVVAPSVQATNIAPSNVMDNTVDISWTNGDGQRRVVAMIQGTESTLPAAGDNIFFNPDSNFGGGDIVEGSWHAVYNGFGNSVSVTGLMPGTDYTIAVLEANGPAWQEFYNVSPDADNPLTFTTTGVAAPEMEVTGLGVEIVSGDVTPDLGDDTDFGNGGVTQQVVKTYTINNLGTADLNLGTDAVSASGDTAFEVGLQPDAVVTAGGSTTFTIVFTAPAENTFNSQVIIFNDDADENPYTFNVTGVGVAAPPSQQASNIVASNIMDNTVDLSWTFGNGFGTVVAMFAGNDPFPVPIDNTTYTANAQFGLGDDIGGGWFVVYVGNGTNVSVTGLTPGQEYSVAALEYYGNAGVELYNGSTDTNNPITFTTTGGADVTAPSVISLTAIPNPIIDVVTQFELVVEFDESMDTGINPTIDFPTENPSTTLAFNTGAWDDPLNFRATYNVTDTNVDLQDIDVQVSGAQDLAGNAMNVFNGPDVFGIDTENPIITVDTYGTSITSPQLTGTVDDVLASISVDVDGSNYPATNNGNGTWTLAAGIITSLADGTYDVVAYANDQAGNLGTDATTDELVISQTVVTLPAEDVTSTSFTARWSEGLDVQTYQIDVSTVADFSTFVTGFQGFQTTATSIAVNNLDFASSYYYRVRLVNTSSEISSNSNTAQVKTTIDPETVADSTALVQIHNAINPQGLNWTTDRLRDWIGITLDATRTRVDQVAISGTSAAGDMPNPFTAGAVGGLSVLTVMDASDNQITGLMDFTGTAINNLNVSGNNLEFDDLEPVVSVMTVDYSNQASLQFNEAAAVAIEVRYTTDFSLSITTGGSGNVYSWFRNDVQIGSGDDFIVNNAVNVILAIDFDNMGTFRTEITNPAVPGLTINVDPQDVLAIADMQVTVSDANGDPLTASLDGFMLETTPIATGFPVLETIENVNVSTFTFPDVVLGDYIILIESDLSLYIPTYFGNVFEWTEADTLLFRSDDVIQMTMTEVPTPLGPGDGDGTLDVLIEEDFGDDGGARIDARRRAAKRKCGLRRKRSGGRTDQEDEFELIAYGETDDNGEFQFGFLPQGTYRFFVEYPGIPIDESSFVEFDVGEAGISDTDFKLQAFATEDGVSVTIEKVLGVILEYFKDLEIFPNPSSSYLNIRYRHLKSGDVTAQLVDLAGNTKWSEDLRNGYNGQLRIDVTDFEEGVYILRFYDRENPQDNVVSFRVIVRD